MLINLDALFSKTAGLEDHSELAKLDNELLKDSKNEFGSLLDLMSEDGEKNAETALRSGNSSVLLDEQGEGDGAKKILAETKVSTESISKERPQNISPTLLMNDKAKVEQALSTVVPLDEAADVEAQEGETDQKLKAKNEQQTSRLGSGRGELASAGKLVVAPTALRQYQKMGEAEQKSMLRPKTINEPQANGRVEQAQTRLQDSNLVQQKLDVQQEAVQSSTKSELSSSLSGQAELEELLSSDNIRMNRPQVFASGAGERIAQPAVSGGEQLRTMNMTDFEKTPTQQLIDKISQYIDQEQFQKTQKLDLVVRHEELGQFSLQVSKGKHNAQQVDLRIQAMAQEGHRFFQENERELMNNLTRNGVKVGEFKLVNSSENSANSSFDQGRDEADRMFAQKEGKQKDQESRREDSERRERLWKQFQEQDAA